MYKTITFISIFLISLITNSQTVSTITNGSFSDGLAVDSTGNIYGSDWGGNTVYKYDTTGNVSIFKNGFSNPNGIGINALDEIYICDHTANSIYKYDTNGNLLASYTTGLTTPAGIKNIPNSTDMLIVEYGTQISSSKIKKLDANGTITTLFSGTPLFGPAGIAFINDVPYIANFNNRRIFRFENGSLTPIAQLSANGVQNNFIGFLSAIGNQLIATQIGENKIYAINPNDGAITLYAGSSAGNNDGDLNTATFNSPNGILGDNANNRIYISEASTTKNLRIIDNALLSTDEFSAQKIGLNLFPNPTSDSLNIKIDKIKVNELTISIFDITGKEVFNKSYKNITNEFNTKINTEPFSSGTYTIMITSDKESISKKVIF